MKFVSTRRLSSSERAPSVGFGAALAQGLAPDGGLYMPQEWPSIPLAAFDGVESLPEVAEVMLRPFVEGDAIAGQIGAIVREAFDFPAPLVPVANDGRLSVLELFHGPTAAFKDFGARFLAASLAKIRGGAGGGAKPLNILVATSGDTGGAVAAAFHRRPGIVVSVLFPKGLVSPTQERQLTCWGENVRSYRVSGSFDDCQRLVKEAFVDAKLKQRFELSSANSINLGRLLPQAVYYAATSLAVWRAHGVAPNFLIPSGNLGNSVACVWARKLGLPIGRIVLAHNSNRAVPDFLRSGDWQPRASIPTLASAMDVGAPSNMERLRALFPDLEAVRGAVRAVSVDDAEIRARIVTDFRNYGKTWCPHTATAAEVYARLPESERSAARWVLVSTAHPAKFAEIVEPLTGQRIEMPESLAKLLSRPVSCEDLQPTLTALTVALEK
ncbi:MAG TPA: threonine synthase [Steroidobacteraceae bacterium]|jgi:threonine synthase|nr:threonine synthase [Steroidobacteraceae bacterium]